MDKDKLGIRLYNVQSDDIGILIGANAPHVHIPSDVKAAESSDPLAIKTMFGWTLFGTHGETKTISINKLVIEPKDDFHQCVQRIWDQECITNPNDRDKAPSIEDNKCYKRLEEETKFIDGKYQVPMLWKKGMILPNNRSLAERRFRQLQGRLMKDTSLFKLYKETIDKYVASGYARKMTPDEAKNTQQRTWYLPHYAVFNPNKPGKIRVVFDLSLIHI